MTIFRDNAKLLEGFKRGRREALAEVYLKYVDDVACAVRRGFVTQSGAQVPGIKDPEIQCEVVQETFARVFSKPARNSFDGTKPFRAYLLHVTRNLMVDRARRWQRGHGLAPHLSEELDADVIEQPQSEPEDPDWVRLRGAASTYVGELDEEARLFVRLRFEQDLSQAGVASQMGCSRRRVRTLEKRVTAGLRRFLRKRGISDS